MAQQWKGKSDRVASSVRMVPVGQIYRFPGRLGGQSGLTIMPTGVTVITIQPSGVTVEPRGAAGVTVQPTGVTINSTGVTIQPRSPTGLTIMPGK